MNYPYLARNFVNGKQYVVLFIEEEKGIVLLNETDSKNIQFGKMGTWDEGAFEILPPDECIRLNN